MKKKMLALVMVLSLLVTSGAMAENVKHERVFGVLDADGNAQTVIDSVWLENKDKADTLKDASSLTGIENVKGKETFAQDGDQLTWQAAGSDIWYQGTSAGPLPVTPVITCTLDGREIAAADVAGKSGKLEGTVTFKSASSVPHLMLTFVMLDAGQTASVTVDNGFTFTDGSHTLVIGYGVTGIDKQDLPDHVTFTCDVNAFDPSDVYTVVTSEPLSRVRTELADDYDSLNKDAREAADDLTKLATDTEITGDSDIAKLFAGLRELTDGTGKLKEGASQLSEGLTTLAGNNDTLNSAASTVFDSLLSAATTQLQAALPSLPALTQTNWRETLDNALTSLDEDTIRAQATEQARAQVEEKVKANEDTIREQVNAKVKETVTAKVKANEAAIREQVDAKVKETVTAKVKANEAAIREQVNAKVKETVTAKVKENEDAIRTQAEAAAQAKVLGAVLKAAGLNLSAEQYDAAVKAGQVTDEQKQQVEAAVKKQMSAKDVKAQIEQAVTDAENQLIEQNLASDEVKKQIEQAVTDAENQLIEQNLASDEVKKQIEQAVTDAENQLVEQNLASDEVKKQTEQAVTDAENQLVEQNLNSDEVKKELESQLATVLKQAEAGAAQLETLQKQLDAYAQFQQGLSDYTAGVSQAQTGAQELADGTETLDGGVNDLRQQVIDKLTPILNDHVLPALDQYQAAADQLASPEHFDLVDGSMSSSLMFVLRTRW